MRTEARAQNAAPDPAIDIVERAVESVLASRERVLLAVSGGVDSTVLLHAAAAVLPLDRIAVATFDHGTGEAATRACALVDRHAAALGVACVRGRAHDLLRGEAAFRDARWQFLRRVAAEYRSDVVCTAHTADDQIETVFMRVLRGAGARGLASLLAGDVVRPMLDLTRVQVVEYAAARRLEWVDDPSNARPDYLRNRVRRDLLPALRRVHASIDDDLLAIGRAAARCRAEIEAVVAEHVRPCRAGDGGIDVPVAALIGLSAAELSTLWPAIAAAGGVTLDRRGLARIVAFTERGAVGASIQISGGWRVVRSRTALELRRANSGHRSETTLAPLPLSDGMIWGRWRFRRIAADALTKVGGEGGGAWTARIAHGAPAVVRAWSPGDAMRVFDRARPDAAPRKVKYFLSDAGVTGSARAGWPVVVSGNEIVWIPGVRRGRAASAVADEPGLTFLCEQISR
jgi:tRNA(Ile)-lysidine synthase